MNTYSRFFKQFSKLGEEEFASFEELSKKVICSLKSFSTNSTMGEAIIVLGYSGNGKTTWIDQYIRNNPSFEIVSMDTISRRLQETEKMPCNPEKLVFEFGKALEEKCLCGKNIIIDGRFLHLLTRLCLTQTLHSYHYSVGAVDLTDDILKILPYRIMDYCGNDLGVKITPQNISEYFKDPRFQARYQHIMQFYQIEKEGTLFDRQKELGLEYCDCDFIVDKENYRKESNKYK